MAVNYRIVYNNFPKIAANLEPRVGKAVAKAALDIEAKAKSAAPVDTGNLKNSIQASEVGPTHWRVTAGADYSLYVEMGTVFMAAQPFMGPAVDQVIPVLTQAIRQIVGSAS
jgi:HK97 gp10 family phage protein